MAGTGTPFSGRSIPGGPVVITDRSFTTGNVYFVHSSGTTTGGYSFSAPITTLLGAVALCTASQGDTIIVMEGHAETIATATAMVIATAGIRVIGLGYGTNRPTFTFSATDSICSITAANVWVENIRLVSDIDNVVTGIDLGASADGCTLKNVELVDGASNKEFLIHVNIATGCHDVTLDGVRVCGLGGGATACVKFVGTSDRLVMKNCNMQGTFSAALVDASAGILLNQQINDNILHNRDTSAGLVYKGNSSSTGFLVRNQVLGAKNNTETISTVTAMHCSLNYGTDVAASTAILTPSTLTAWT